MGFHEEIIKQSSLIFGFMHIVKFRVVPKGILMTTLKLFFLVFQHLLSLFDIVEDFKVQGIYFI